MLVLLGTAKHTSRNAVACLYWLLQPTLPQTLKQRQFDPHDQCNTRNLNGTIQQVLQQ
jgi:hypothetical protein